MGGMSARWQNYFSSSELKEEKIYQYINYFCFSISSDVRKNCNGYETFFTPLYKCYKEYFRILKHSATYAPYVRRKTYSASSSCLASTEKNCTAATNLLNRHSASKINT